MKVTLSVIKADIGGLVGHSSVHPKLVETAYDHLNNASLDIIDFLVRPFGDDLGLVLTHQQGPNNTLIHKIAFDVFMKCTQVAKRLKLYGAGQDLLKDSFSQNLRGMGPGYAEMEFEGRISDPVIVFMADKTSAGAWNPLLHRAFADPYNTLGLIVSPELQKGFRFEVQDSHTGSRVFLDTPEENYVLLALIGSPSRYLVKSVYSRHSGEIASVSSAERLSQIAGKYVGKDDPVCIVRCQGVFPAVGEVVEPYAHPIMVSGWMRGSHNGPLMPVAFEDAMPIRFDGPPRVIALGFQLADGIIGEVKDIFADKSFDLARTKANELAYDFRRQGPFEPHRLPEAELEYTTLEKVQELIKDRWQPIE